MSRTGKNGTAASASARRSEALTEQALSLLSQVRVMTLATAGPEGPWASTLAFAFDRSLNLYFVSRKECRHIREIERSDQVAAALHEEQPVEEQSERYDPKRARGLQIRGSAAILADGEREPALECYIARFPEAESAVRTRVCERGSACIVRIRPSEVRLTDREQFPRAVTVLPVPGPQA